MSFLEAINQSLKTLVESLIATALILLEYFWVFQDYPPNCQGKSFRRDTCPPASLRPPPVFQLLPALTLLTSEISSLTFLIWRGGGPVLWSGLLVGWNSCHWQCCKRHTEAQIENQTVLRVFEPGEIVNGVVKGNPEAPDVIGACKTVVVSIIGCHVAELLGDKMPRPGFSIFEVSWIPPEVDFLPRVGIIACSPLTLTLTRCSPPPPSQAFLLQSCLPHLYRSANTDMTTRRRTVATAARTMRMRLV